MSPNIHYNNTPTFLQIFRTTFGCFLSFIIIILSAKADAEVDPVDHFVTYEAFGAVGDGVHDDLPAIVAAHAHANEKGLPVISRPDAIYHLGRQAITATIATDTNWSTSRFIIDDRDVENHKESLFKIRSLLQSETLSIKQLRRDQERLDGQFDHDFFVIVKNENVRRYIRRGLNQNAGTAQRDCFILKKDGSIASPIDWDYDHITEVIANPIESDRLTVSGGVFTTIANNMRQEVGYNYWKRNIDIQRSNTIVDGLTHYVTGETAVGHPYNGFLSVSSCANITLQNCFASGHKAYTTIGSVGKPVSMGSYDYSANSVVNFSMINCRMNHILDRTLWGVIGTNFCKNILIEDCELSRMDAHMGVSGTYIIRRTTLGNRGLNAIGRGQLILEDSTLHGGSLINLRNDYGSTWEGTVEIRNCNWIPSTNAKTKKLILLNLKNDGQHDFGYPCFMPLEISINGLQIDDSGFTGQFYYFADPGIIDPEQVPHPYHFTQTIRVHDLKVASGKKFILSSNPYLASSTTLITDTNH